MGTHVNVKLFDTKQDLLSTNKLIQEMTLQYKHYKKEKEEESFSYYLAEYCNIFLTVIPFPASLALMVSSLVDWTIKISRKDKVIKLWSLSGKAVPTI